MEQTNKMATQITEPKEEQRQNDVAGNAGAK